MSEDTPERIWADPEGHDFDKVDLGVGNTEYIRADLARAAPTVKPLEWCDLSDSHSNAHALFGAYYNIHRSRTGKSWVVTSVCRRGSDTLGFSENAEEAKAAAQADYERRILSTLK